jgi:hypothetical protein
VEHHPVVRNLRLQLFEQVPGDGLAFAVFISGQQQFVSALEQVLELRYLLALVVRHDIEGLEVVVHVDAEPGPRLLAVLGGNLRCLVGHVPDVADAGLNDVAVAQIARDRAGLGRRLDDHQPGAVTAPGGSTPRRPAARTGRLGLRYPGRLPARSRRSGGSGHDLRGLFRRRRILGGAFPRWHALSQPHIHASALPVRRSTGQRFPF